MTPQIVTGILVLEVEKNTNGTAAKTEKWLIKTVYSEFNSGKLACIMTRIAAYMTQVRG